MNTNKKNDDYLANAASMHEATGLIPANPFPDIMETYEDVFHYEPPKIKTTQKQNTFPLLPYIIGEISYG